MSWFDHQDSTQDGGGQGKVKKKQCDFPVIEIKLPGGTDFIPVNKNCVERKYEDEMKPIIVILDEVAELLGSEKGSSEAVKEENAIKAEIEAIIKSITQLGRSAGIHMILATQRNGTDIIPGVIQANCLSVEDNPPILQK